MARNRLADVNRTYGDASAPVPAQNAYPPPSNAAIGQTRPSNPYAQQNIGAAPGGNYNNYGAPASNGYPAQNGYSAPTGNAYGQQQYGQEQSYSQGGYGAAAPAGATTGDFWADLSSINQNLATLEQEIQAVRAAHQQSLASTDASSASRTDELNERARATREQVKNQIKQLYDQAKGDKAKKSQAAAVKARFTTILNEHGAVEKEFRKKVKERVVRQYKIVKPDATEDEIREVVESDNPQVFSQALLGTNRYGDARVVFREVQERHAEIQKVERTLTELAQMFNELALLIDGQDDAINVIANDTRNVHSDVEAGLNETNKAVVSARKARRKKWICFWIVVAIIVILALILGLYFGVGKK